MNLDETGDVLAKLAAFDQRTIGEADVLAWHEIIGYLDRADCLAAVTAHYAETRERAMPADIRKLAIGIRDRRKAPLERANRAIEAGSRDRSTAVTALIRSVVDRLPEPDAHARAVSRARRERGRPDRLGTAVKKRKPKRPDDFPAPTGDEVARLATRYLLDGYPPDAVAEKLAVSRRWCRRTIQRLRAVTEREDTP